MEDLVIGGQRILPGESQVVQLAIPKLYDYTDLALPVKVIRGKADGPRLFVAAAVHGDELNGVEIIRRLLKLSVLRKLRGTLIAIPIVNVYGFLTRSRYFPDHRDLNRCFPGAPHGSLASQVADLIMREIVSRATYGIDLHTGAGHRYNLPQVRASLTNEETRRLAHEFGVPVIINASVRDGSLRQSALESRIPTLVYEGGEALRFDENVIRVGVNGVTSVMRAIGMLPLRSTQKRKPSEAFVARGSHWVRAPHSGMLTLLKQVGDRVEEGELLGVISDPFGDDRVEVRARRDGIIIGYLRLPLVNRGDALLHVATFEDLEQVESAFEQLDFESWGAG